MVQTSNKYDFVNDFYKKFNNIQKGRILIGGDFNITGDPNMDTTSTTQRHQPALNPFLRTNNLFNIWRCQHGIERDFSYFSSSHLSYSRIDSFLADKITLQDVTASSIGSITWSDHAPVSITVGNRVSKVPFIWRLDSSLIADSALSDNLPFSKITTLLKWVEELNLKRAVSVSTFYIYGPWVMAFGMLYQGISNSRSEVMEEKNMSNITMIQLLGLQTPHSITFLIFLILLLIYCVTICGNLLIITLVSYSKSLHSPMYFFLSQLSALDILLATNILPNTLHTVLMKGSIISFSDCISQFFFFCVSEASECLLLTVMCYDRYMAICKPLQYALIMNVHLCWTMIITCWILSVILSLILTLTISKLTFCGPNIVDHFFCDLEPILQLSCSDPFMVLFEVTLIIFGSVVIPFFIIIVSYVYIIFIIFKIPSNTGRKKVFSTCSSHLTVVCIYYGTIVCVYLVPRRGQSWDITKFVSLVYTVVTPLMNPIIYSLRNKDLKSATAKIFNHCQHLHFRKL
ncbi:olfactory receptor 11L1-like [Rana temporaria]|uniref:olfactory receptor 11L1-like n=1 Tax=Rana temporaria TaxID=8407 RepID=UPI001AAC7693|nr:olfactory receptor 11L1-like [Rana temporaria]